MADDTFNMVDRLLSNEDMGKSPIKNGPKEPYKKQKKYAPRPVYKDATPADMKLNGWNLDFDKDYEEVYTVGDISDGMKVLTTASLFNMACVYSAKYWIYGRGINVEEALKDCLRNIKSWKRNNPNQKPTKRDVDKGVADILEEAGL